MSDLSRAKADLRKQMRTRRDGLGSADAMVASQAAAAAVVHAVEAGPTHAVAAFLSLPGEIDTQPLITALLEAGSEILLPRIVGKGLPLAFHAWRPAEPLETASLGVRQPCREPQTRAEPADRSASGLRQGRLSARLWRWLLRPHACRPARSGRRTGGRLRLRPAAGRCGAARSAGRAGRPDRHRDADHRSAPAGLTACACSTSAISSGDRAVPS